MSHGRIHRQNEFASAADIKVTQKSSATLGDPPRVTLPVDLAGSLKYLDDAQLERLRDAVALEIGRRTPTKKASKSSAKNPASNERTDKVVGIDDVPGGKANLIRAWFKAGVKPAAIAREFRISRSLVNRILAAPMKGKGIVGVSRV